MSDLLYAALYAALKVYQENDEGKQQQQQSTIQYM